MLMDIKDQIKDTIADKLIIQSIYSWYPYMTFLDDAQLIMQAVT